MKNMSETIKSTESVRKLLFQETLLHVQKEGPRECAREAEQPSLRESHGRPPRRCCRVITCTGTGDLQRPHHASGHVVISGETVNERSVVTSIGASCSARGAPGSGGAVGIREAAPHGTPRPQEEFSVGPCSDTP